MNVENAKYSLYVRRKERSYSQPVRMNSHIIRNEKITNNLINGKDKEEDRFIGKNRAIHFVQSVVVKEEVVSPFTRKYNEKAFSQISFKPRSTQITKHDHLLSLIKPSEEFFVKRRNKRSFSLSKNEEAIKLMQQYKINLDLKPERSILKKETKNKRRRNTVSFNIKNEVFEVENWKLYNIDAAKENPYFNQEKKCIIT